jgi:hypothetical protein
MSPLLTSSFWFGAQTYPFTPLWTYITLTVIACTLFGAIAVRERRFRLKGKLERKIAARAFSCFLSAGVIGLLLYFITWQRIPFLGMRVVWVVWFFAHALWGYMIWSAVRRDIPAMRAAMAEREAYEKWLPKSKK